tara:strand:- start:729 stop:1112 length:384 start_codon:yes stop_codon:yes gene_type:complete
MSQVISKKFTEISSVETTTQMRGFMRELYDIARAEMQDAIDKNDSDAGFKVLGQVQKLTFDFMNEPKLYMGNSSDLWIDTLAVLGNITSSISFMARQTWPEHDVWKREKDALERLKALGREATRKKR